MTTAELIRVLRHYAALNGTQCPGPGLLLEAAAALDAAQPKRPRRRKQEVQTQDFAFAPAMRHDME